MSKKSSNVWNFFIPAAAPAWIAAAWISPSAGQWLVQEDGPVQWLQFVLLIGAAAVFAVRSGNHPKRALLLGLAAFSFFIAMEEISWGQRVLHFAIPPALDQVNVQEEFTIHNLMGLQRIRHWGLVLFALAGARYLPASYRPVLATIFIAGFVREAMEITYSVRGTAAVFAARFWAGRFCEIGELGVACVLFQIAARFVARLDKDLAAGIPSGRYTRDN